MKEGEKNKENKKRESIIRFSTNPTEFYPNRKITHMRRVQHIVRDILNYNPY